MTFRSSNQQLSFLDGPEIDAAVASMAAAWWNRAAPSSPGVKWWNSSSIWPLLILRRWELR